MDLTDKQWAVIEPFFAQGGMYLRPQAGMSMGSTTRSTEWYSLDTADRGTLAGPTEAISTIPDLPPLVPTVGVKRVMKAFFAGISPRSQGAR